MAPTELMDKGKPVDRGARRREKSRDAARCRRQQESDTYNEICKAIPIPPKTLAQMDRSTVMRLLISFMKLRGIVNTAELKIADSTEEHLDCGTTIPDSEYIDALNGFVVVLSHDCDILFVSANVKQYVGIASLDLMGQNLFSYTHEGDHLEITNCMKESSGERTAHSFFMRMRSTLTSTGKNVNLKSALYKVLKCEGVVHQSHDDSKRFMVAYCEPIPHPANIEMVLDCSTFLSQHSLDMKFTFCDDDRISNLLMYSEDDMIGKSFYDFCYTEDIKSVDESFKKLFRLGQVTTDHYRLLTKSGGYVWVISQATIINNPRNQQPSYIVCVHYVISGVMQEKCILSLSQLKYVEENGVRFPKLEEITTNELEDCTEATFENTDPVCDPFCDSTNSVFLGPSDATDVIFDSTSEIFVPCKESMEIMAKNAPSIGDELEYSQMGFTDAFIIDEDMCKNAPSIGDPSMDFQFSVSSPKGSPAMTVNVDRVKGFLKDEFANGCNNEDTVYQKPRSREDMWIKNIPNSMPPGGSSVASVTATKRKLPKDSQIISVPKMQYQRHVQPSIELGKDSGTYKFNPPEQAAEMDFQNPPNKKQKQQQIYIPGENDTSWQQKEYQSSFSPPARVIANMSPSSVESAPHDLLVTPLCSPDSNCNFGTDAWERDRDSPLWPQFCAEGNNYDFKPISKETYWDRGPSLPRIKSESKSLLPVLSLQDCEVNAPVDDNSSTVDWLAFSDVLSGVA